MHTYLVPWKKLMNVHGNFLVIISKLESEISIKECLIPASKSGKYRSVLWLAHFLHTTAFDTALCSPISSPRRYISLCDSNILLCATKYWEFRGSTMTHKRRYIYTHSVYFLWILWCPLLSPWLYLYQAQFFSNFPKLLIILVFCQFWVSIWFEEGRFGDYNNYRPKEHKKRVRVGVNCGRRFCDYYYTWKPGKRQRQIQHTVTFKMLCPTTSIISIATYLQYSQSGECQL